MTWNFYASRVSCRPVWVTCFVLQGWGICVTGLNLWSCKRFGRSDKRQSNCLRKGLARIPNPRH